VDEFQDCNEEQLQLIEHIKGKETQLFVVGDQNQSIYGWRGSKEHLFEETQQRWETTWMKLPQNYRSTKTILTAAETLLQSDKGCLIATRQNGSPIDLVRHFDDQQEAYYLREILLTLQKEEVPLDTVAVLFRTHQQIGIVETVLQQAAIPHQLVKRTELHEDKAQSFLLHLLKICINNNNIDACLSLICDSTFGVCQRSQSLIRQLKDRASDTSALEASIQYLEKQKNPSALHLNLLQKVKSFIEEFTAQESNTSQDLMAYFDLESLLKPTSIHHKEYMASVTEAWTQLAHYAKQQGGGKLALNLHAAIDQVVLEGTFQVNDRIQEKGHGVHLLTIHASKGLEFDRIYIAGANTGIIPLTQHQRGNENIQEEKRLLFVAMTRGKNKVEIGWHTQPSKRNTESCPSYFLNNIPENLLHRRTAKDSTPVTKKEEEWSINTPIRHKKYGSGKITALDDKALSCTFDSVGEKTFSRAFAKALLTIVE
jgi:DNA helicase-2/ATP-dependent DNA helicase PcrA